MGDGVAKTGKRSRFIEGFQVPESVNVKPEVVRNKQTDSEKHGEKNSTGNDKAKDREQAMNEALQIAKPENSEILYDNI